MSHIQYTLGRSGRYYYNRRVPKRAVQAYGSCIRLALFKDPGKAAAYAKRLGNVLKGSWSNASRIQPVDVAAIIDCFKPKSSLLSEISERGVPGPYAPRVALYTFISTAAGRSVNGYKRECTTLLVTNKKTKGKKFQ